MEGWHIECCHAPPGVGDRVSWPLLWVDDDGSPGARLAGPRTYVPIPGDVVLRPVTRSPRWFDSGATAREPLPDAYRQDSGVLVRLRVEEPNP